MADVFRKTFVYTVLVLGLLPLGAWGQGAFSDIASGVDRALAQLDPETEQLDQVSEPIGELAEPVEGSPTDPLDAVSESDDQASEEIGADSETAAEASEILPPAPGGEEYGAEDEAPEEQMPLGDREAEGKGLGY